MKKLTTGLTLATLCLSTTVYADSFSAKHAGQGFTGLTKDFTSALSNPALLTKYDNDDDVYFSLNLGIIGSDEYDVIDNGEDIADNIDAFDESIDNIANVTPEDAPAYLADLLAQVDTITNSLVEIDQRPVQFREGFNALIIAPNKHLSFGLFANQYGRLAAIVDYSDNDKQALLNAVSTGQFEQNQLNSQAVGVGYSVLEAGIMFGYPVIKDEKYDVSIGAKIKYQRLDLFYNRINVADFDEDEFDLTDDEFLTDSNGTNLDLGLYTNWGEKRQWHFALVINDLSEQDVTLEAQDLTFTLESTAEAGISYQNDWVTLAAELDLVDRETFQELAPVKYASVGAEFRWSEHMQFRLGARTDLNDNEQDLYTLGLGISPWDVVALDLAGFTGDKDTIGVAIQLGWKI